MIMIVGIGTLQMEHHNQIDSRHTQKENVILG